MAAKTDQDITQSPTQDSESQTNKVVESQAKPMAPGRPATPTEQKEDEKKETLTIIDIIDSMESPEAALTNPFVTPIPSKKKIDIGHQECSLIVEAIEGIYSVAQEQSGGNIEWIYLKHLPHMLVMELVYEDVDELEEGMGMTCEEFADCLPHVEIMQKGDDKFWKVVEPKPGDPIRLIIPVEKPEDLWRVVCKAPDSVILIPEADDFQAGKSLKRQTDTIFNFIAKFQLDLSITKRHYAAGAPAIQKVIDMLDELVNDDDKPFRFILEDPSGMSLVEPKDGVKTELLTKGQGNWNETPATVERTNEPVSLARIAEIQELANEMDANTTEEKVESTVNNVTNIPQDIKEIEEIEELD